MKKILLFLVIALTLTGCSNWLDVNDDPNNPKDIPMSMLLPEIERSIAETFNAGEGIGQDLGVYTHQLTTREAPDKYGVGGNEYYLNLSWSKTYVNVLQNLDMLIQKAENENTPYYLGIAKILKAYTFGEYVDLFGDIPFSEANKKSEGILYAKFDTDSDIYPQLITLLDEGIADLNKSKGAIYPGSDDLIFTGSSTKWIKTANTIKLKMYNQIRLVDSSVSTKIADLLTNSPLISSTDEGFMFPYTDKRSPVDERNPEMVDTYEATQKSTCMSPWFFEILKGINPLFSGIEDPRIPYYFYQQLTATESGKDGNPFEYRVGGFTSIYFGSDGVDRDHGQDKSITIYGIYPCGGRYDEGDAVTVTTTSGTGAAPYRFITYADRLYIEAELIQAGVITGDVKEKLKDAITESFKQVDNVVASAKGTQLVPSLSGTTAVTTYISKILDLFTAGDDSKKMEIIMTQKWIQSFGSFVDQYTDYRRTGYPVLFDPNNATMAPGGYVTPPAGGDPDRTLPAVKVSCSVKYPLSLPWSTDELNVNKNAPTQKTDLSTANIFWDK